VKIIVRGVRRDEPDLRRLARMLLRQLMDEGAGTGTTAHEYSAVPKEKAS
jgi:hypothetical protein